MKNNSNSIYFIFIIFILSIYKSNQIDLNNWNYKFSFTKNINSQMSIECENNDQIWIGWSHYGTRTPNTASSPLLNSNQVVNFPNENDCWMNFTEKIAEQCNGSPQCDLSSQPTYIHKCGKISDYLYVAYKCIKEQDTFDICKTTKRVYNQAEMQSEQKSFYIKSSEFPIEYSSSLDCSCLISSNQQQNLKLEVLWFSLQDNDYLNIFNKNLTGWINPTYEMPISTKTNSIRFLTDDSLAYKGFWLKISNRKACKDDWQLVGDSCVKVFNEQLDWRSANQKCLQMNGNLLKIDDVVSDLKLTQYMKSFYPEINSYWIGLRKYVDQYNQEKWMWSSNSTLYNDVSWWPWRRASHTQANEALNAYSISNSNNCVMKRKNEDGYFTTSCDTSNKNSFICQTSTMFPINKELNPISEISLQCGNTDEIQKELNKIEKLEKLSASLLIKKPRDPIEKSLIIADDSSSIGINSINNIILPTFKPSTKQVPLRVNINSLNIEQKDSKQRDEYSQTTLSKHSNFIKINSFPSSTSSSSSSSSSLSSSSSSSSILVRQAEAKLNTAILAGIISGIGLVILIINIGVLFMCRRNLKKLLKSTKETPREDMIQEYFEAFNTLHNSKTLRGTLASNTNTNMIKAENILTIPQLQQQLRTNSTTSTDDSLLHESAQLFYPQQFNREVSIRQSSAFKPFSRDLNETNSNLLQIQNQNLDLQRQLLITQQQLQRQTNQYDKMTHQPAVKSKNLLIQNDSTGQYAHTYESLDTLELPNRRAIVHLGISSRNYRTVLNDSNNLLQSPNSTDVTEAGNFNLSTSTNLSSTSGTSSTHQFIKPNQLDFRLVDSQNLVQFQQQQQQQPQQMSLTHNQLVQFNNLMLNNKNNNTSTFLNQNFPCDQTGIFNLVNSSELANSSDVNCGGEWSPDSAYYSSIPTLNNYASFNMKTQPQTFTNQQLQQFIINNPFSCSNNVSNNSNNIENFKSHLV